MSYELIFSKEAFTSIQQALGHRPGNYKIDPFYIRKGIADKPYFWNEHTRKWEILRLGDILVIEDDGSVSRIPVEQSGKVYNG